MSRPALVLDNSVLSSLLKSGWFDAAAFYTPEHSILVSARVWNEEFIPYHRPESEPDWMTVREADLRSVETQARGQLSKPDWSCIALAEQTDAGSTVVTNDRTLRTVANRRQVQVEWGTQFVIRTFEACRISVSDYEAGLPTYLADVPLPDDVEDELRNAEK